MIGQGGGRAIARQRRPPARMRTMSAQFDDEELRGGSMFARCIPICRFLSNYSASDFGGDLIAGLSVGGVTVPTALAHAAVANVSHLLAFMLVMTDALFLSGQKC
jgi:hypothetical protein